MSNGVWIALIVMFVLFLMDVPIAYSLIFSTLVYFVTSSDLPFIAAVQRLVGGLESVPLLCIPFFIMAGVFMNHTGISRRLVSFAEVLTGHLPGGLAQVNVVLSTLMGGLSGSNIADAAMQSKILVPEMVKRGYSPAFSAAVTAASALITPIIPPGIALIIFGYVANVSIGRLFLAGVVPGILTCVLMMVAVHIMSVRRGYQPARPQRAGAGEVFRSARTGMLALALPLIIIMGIRFGVFTPTEAGSIAVAYALVLGTLVYREMNVSQLKQALMESVASTANIMLIIAAASSFSKVLTWERVPHVVTEGVTGAVSGPGMFLLLVNVFLLVLGMFIEGNAALIVLTPLLVPVAEAFGVDPVHFGIIFIFNLSIGTVTPPMGTVMFTTCSITGVKVDAFVREAVPFWGVLLICLLIITYAPGVSLWLPRLIYGG
jgi:tripartite ATP-independent transporter DctM subunit